MEGALRANNDGKRCNVHSKKRENRRKKSLKEQTETLLEHLEEQRHLGEKSDRDSRCCCFTIRKNKKKKRLGTTNFRTVTKKHKKINIDVVRSEREGT